MTTMADTLNTPPTEVRAGDTLRWTRSIADYPAGTWTLGYTFVSRTGAYSVAASASGTDHSIEVAAAVTAAWPPGLYSLVEYATNGAERVTICSRPFRVLADLAAVTTTLETRTHARKVLDSIEAWLESKAPSAASFEIAGRRLQNYPIEQLLALRDRYRAEVLAEDRAAAGKAPVRILMRL